MVMAMLAMSTIGCLYDIKLSSWKILAICILFSTWYFLLEGISGNYGIRTLLCFHSNLPWEARSQNFPKVIKGDIVNLFFHDD